MRPDEIVDALAATQHGVVARHQLLSAGLTPRQVDVRVANGRLAAVHTSVYLVRGHPRTFLTRVAAACLAAGPDSAASHRCAAQLHGIDVGPAPVEILVPAPAHPRLRNVVVHRVGELPSVDTARRSGVPVTAPARTLIDLASVLDDLRLEAAVDDALFRKLVTTEVIADRLDALGRQGREGAGTLARLLDERLDGVERPQTWFERRLFRVLTEAGLPLPTPQFHVVLPDGRDRYLDYAYGDILFAIEGDSYQSHSKRSDWAADHIRNRELIALGWRIMPATWDDLRRPGPFVDAVSRGLSVLLRPA